MAREKKPMTKLKTRVKSRPPTWQELFALWAEHQDTHGATQTTGVSQSGEAPVERPPWLDEPVVAWLYQSGIAELSEIHSTDPEEAKAILASAASAPRDPDKLPWQSLQEARKYHLWIITTDVLMDPMYGALGKRSVAELEEELRGSLGAEGWTQRRMWLNGGVPETQEVSAAEIGIEHMPEWAGSKWTFRSSKNSIEEKPFYEVFVRAHWAEVFAEPLSVVWIAAMAQHAHLVVKDNYAAGYLTALLDQKLKKEDLFVRGLVNKESTDAGGQKQADNALDNRTRVLAEMERLLASEKGKRGVRWAAKAAAGNGVGTSESSNRQIWYRWKDRHPPQKEW